MSEMPEKGYSRYGFIFPTAFGKQRPFAGYFKSYSGFGGGGKHCFGPFLVGQTTYITEIIFRFFRPITVRAMGRKSWSISAISPAVPTGYSGI